MLTINSRYLYAIRSSIRNDFVTNAPTLLEYALSNTLELLTVIMPSNWYTNTCVGDTTGTIVNQLPDVVPTTCTDTVLPAALFVTIFNVHQ